MSIEKWGTLCGLQSFTRRSALIPQQTATIQSLPMAFKIVKEMQATGLDWGEGYHPLGR